METAKQVTEQMDAGGLPPRSHGGCAPVRDARKPERATVLRLLNQALATHIVCTLRLRRTRRLMEEVLAGAEAHAAALARLLQGAQGAQRLARA